MSAVTKICSISVCSKTIWKYTIRSADPTLDWQKSIRNMKRRSIIPMRSMTVTTGLVNLLGVLLSIAPPESEFDPEMVTEMNPWERKRLERILGKKISPVAFACYFTQEEYEQEQGLGMYM